MATINTTSSGPAARSSVGLAPTTADWLNGLPPELSLRQTATAFPHVTNRIAELWKTPRMLDRYFDDLLVDRRGNRKGFPLGVAMEITDLREYYQSTVYPLKACLWDGQA